MARGTYARMSPPGKQWQHFGRRRTRAFRQTKWCTSAHCSCPRRLNSARLLRRRRLENCRPGFSPLPGQVNTPDPTTSALLPRHCGSSTPFRRYRLIGAIRCSGSLERDTTSCSRTHREAEERTYSYGDGTTRGVLSLARLLEVMRIFNSTIWNCLRTLHRSTSD